MKKCTIEEINSNVPGLVINNDGEFIIMDDNDLHRVFFNKLINENLNIDLGTDNLKILTDFILKDLNYLPYVGCTSGDRKYEGGTLVIKDSKCLSDEQISSVIKLYSLISSSYDMEIIDLNDEEISLGEIYEEMLNRNSISK